MPFKTSHSDNRYTRIGLFFPLYSTASISDQWSFKIVNTVFTLFHMLLRNTRAIFYVMYPNKLELTFKSERLNIPKFCLKTNNRAYVLLSNTNSIRTVKNQNHYFLCSSQQIFCQQGWIQSQFRTQEIFSNRYMKNYIF